MLEIGTTLIPRSGRDYEIVVKAVEGGKYVVESLEFGIAGPFTADTDELAKRWDCKRFDLAIDEDTEQRGREAFTTEVYSEHLRQQRKAKRRVDALPTPEQAIAAEEARKDAAL